MFSFITKELIPAMLQDLDYSNVHLKSEIGRTAYYSNPKYTEEVFAEAFERTLEKFRTDATNEIDRLLAEKKATEDILKAIDVFITPPPAEHVEELKSRVSEIDGKLTEAIKRFEDIEKADSFVRHYLFRLYRYTK